MLGHVSTHPVLTWGAEKWRRVKNCSSTSGHLRPTPRLSHLPTDSHVKMQHYRRSKHINSLLLEPVSSWPFWQLYCFFSFLPHLFKLCWGLKLGRGECVTGSCRPVSVIHLQWSLLSHVVASSPKNNNVVMTKITNHRVMFFKVKHHQLFTESSSVNSHWCLSLKCLNVVKGQSQRRQPCYSRFPASGDPVCSRPVWQLTCCA